MNEEVKVQDSLLHMINLGSTVQKSIFFTEKWSFCQTTSQKLFYGLAIQTKRIFLDV